MNNDYDDSDDKPEPKKSEFNTGPGFMSRIDNWITMCNISYINNDPYSWNKYLRVLYQNLVVKMGQEQRTRLKNSFDFLVQPIELYIRRKNSNQMVGVDINVLNRLEEIQTELLDLAEKYNLLMPNKESFLDRMREED